MSMIRTISLARLAPMTLAALAGLGLGACDQDTPASRTVHKTATEVKSIGDAGPAYQGAEKSYKAAAAALDPLGQEKDGAGERGLVLSAQAKLGLGEAASGRALDTARELSTRMNAVRHKLSYRSGRIVAAIGAEAFDPKSELERITQVRGEHQGKIASLTQEREGVAAEIELIRAQAKTLLDSANAELTQYGRLMDHSGRVSATEAAGIIERAHEAKKRGEELRKQGQLLDAQADGLAPVLAEKQLQLEQHKNLIAGLTASAEAMSARESASKQAAADARADAANAEAELDRLVGEVLSYKSADADQAFDAAARQLTEAASTAQRATSVPEQGKVIVGSAKQNLSDLHLSRSRLSAEMSALLAQLAAAEPPLAKSGEYKAQSDELKKAHEEQLNNAKDALEGAKSAYASVPVRGPAKEKLKALVEQLEGKSKSTEAAATDAAAATPEASPAPTGDAEAELRGAVAALVESARAGDGAALIARMHVTDPAIKELLEAMAPMQAKSTKLNEVCKAKFGKSLQEAMASNPQSAAMAAQMNGQIDLTSVDPASLAYKVEGEKGTVTAEGKSPLAFVKIGGAWLLDASSMPGMDQLAGPAGAMMKPMLGKFGAMYDELTQEVNDGKHADVNAVLQAMMQKMMAAMQPPAGGG